MKNIYLVNFFLMMGLATFAHSKLSPEKRDANFKHLYEVNNNWQLVNVSTAKQNLSFQNDVDRISYHLLAVEELLRDKELKTLSPTQKSKRLKMLDVLHAYALTKQFPINSYHEERTPYFIDAFGTHCAVGYLVMMSGNGAISRDISESQNYAYVKDIHSNDLVHWAQDFGFELEELALIQPSYPSNITYDQVGEGVNGRVKTLAEGSDGTIYLGGDFTQIGDVPCHHVAFYQNNQLSCLGGGLDGVVNDISVRENSVYVAGKFTYLGQSYPLAIFENGNWQFVDFLDTEDEEGTAIDAKNSKICLALLDNSNKGYVYQKYITQTTWKWLMETNGPIFTISSNLANNKTYGGKFTSAVVQKYIYHQPSSSSLPYVETVSTNNLLQEYFYDSFSNPIQVEEWNTFSDGIPDTVFCSAYQGANTYIGGYAASAAHPDSSTVLFARILNYNVQPVIDLAQFNPTLSPMKMYDISSNPYTSKVLVGGQMEDLAGGMTTQTKNVYYFDPVMGYIEDAGYVMQDVHAVLMTTNQNFIGGDFSDSSWSSPANHIAKTAHQLELEESTLIDFQIFPNPCSDNITISTFSESSYDDIQVIDLMGKKVDLAFENGKADVSKIESSIYFINLMKDGKLVGINRFIKQ
ncbi:MAG: T9SS type A sorting domain-containing protein [Bacteroidota bacterium]